MASYDITVKLVDQTKSALGRIDSGLKGIAATASKTQDTLDKMTGGLTRAGAVAGAALGLATRAAVGYAASINDASEATDISRQSILALGQAMSTNGGEASKATEAVIALTASIGDAQNGAGTAANALYELGLGYADIKNLSPQQQFEAVVKALGAVESSTDSARLTTDLFKKTLKGVNARGLAADYAALVGAQDSTAGAIAKVGQASDKLNASWIRIQGSIVKALAPAAEFINKLSPAQIDGLVSSIGQLAVALVGVTAGLKLISLVSAGIGTIAGYFVLFGKGATIAGAGLAMMGKSIASLGTTAAITYSVLKNYAAPAWITAIKNGGGLLAQMALTFATLGKRIGFALVAVGGFGGAIKMLLGGFVRMIPLIGTIIAVGSILNSIIKTIFEIDIIDTFIGKVKDAYSALKGLVGIKGPTFLSPEENDNEIKRMQNRANAAQAQTPGGPKNKFIEETLQTLDLATKNYNELSAAMKQTTSLNQLALIFAKLSSEAETLGIVLQKPAALIQRDYAMSVKKAAEELRQHEIELANTTTTTAKWNNELAATTLQIYEQSLKLQDSAYMQKLLNQEIAQGNMSLMEQSKRLNNSGYQSDKFSQSLSQNALDTQQQQITLTKLNEAYDSGRISLELYAKMLGSIDESLLSVSNKIDITIDQLNKETNSLVARNAALQNSTVLTKMFGNEVLAAKNALDEETARLASVTTQQELFNISIERNRNSVKAQEQSLGFLSQAYADGKITLQEYTAGLEQLDDALLTSTQVLDAALGSAQREIYITDTRREALEKLNGEFRAGAIDAKNYRAAAGKLGGDTEDIDRAVNVYGTFKDKLIENNEYIKKSIKGAANTFSKEFTEAFVQAKNPLEAFKNFFGNILSDIANRMVKQHLADPLSEALIGMAEQVIGSKGDGKVGTIMTEGMNATGDDIVDTMKSVGSKLMDVMGISADGISDIFSGMSDSLGDMFSGLFDWIMDGIGSIGSSMGGLGGGGDMFGGIISSIGSFLGFADGGRPPVGQASLVGENGPELFVPDSGGTIVPNDQMGSGSNDPLVVNFNLNAIDTMTGTQFLLQNKPAIISMVGEAYNKRGRRGPLD